MKTEEIAYEADGARMLGYLAVDDKSSAKRPGVLLGHAAPGLDDHTRGLARRLAGLGYVAFAMDYHGGARIISDRNEMMQTIGGYMANPAPLRVRAKAALDVLVAQPQTNPSKLAAIGYCFGGTTVLELARSGAPLAGTVGFHAGLKTAAPKDARNIRGKVLLLLGADDPLVPADERLGFEQEMRDAGIDWQMTLYGGAVHAFTMPGSEKLGMPGIAYHELSDVRSWRAMLNFFDEVLGPVQ